MPELNEADALRIAQEYYSKTFTHWDAVRIVTSLFKVDIVGLIISAYNQGVLDERGER